MSRLWAREHKLCLTSKFNKIMAWASIKVIKIMEVQFMYFRGSGKIIRSYNAMEPCTRPQYHGTKLTRKEIIPLTFLFMTRGRALVMYWWRARHHSRKKFWRNPFMHARHPALGTIFITAIILCARAINYSLRILCDVMCVLWCMSGSFSEAMKSPKERYWQEMNAWITSFQSHSL